MSTQSFYNSQANLLNNLKNNKDQLLATLKLNAEQFSPIFSIAGAMLKTRSLIESGFEPTVTELLIPHLAMTFGPKLLANTLSPRFQPTLKDFLIYIIGFLISLFGQSNTFLMFLANEIPHIGRFFSLVNMKNSPDDTFKLFTWSLTCEFASVFISKLIMKKKLKMSHSAIASLILVNAGVLYLREYKMNDYFVILVANVVPLACKAVEYLKSMLKRKDVKPKQEIYSSPRKVQRRKASLASQIERSKE